jgi:hypothetical protein
MPVPSFKLPMAFDAARLRNDLARIRQEEWTPHFNQRQYDGDWSGVALRTTVGAHVPLYPDPAKNDYVDLPVLDRCAYFREVLTTLRCPLRMVRLLKLSAGSNILEHRDFGLCYEEGEVRLHIPIQTNPEVEFVVGGQPAPMREGECWYINFDLPHRIHNRGGNDRIHLVIDCQLDPWLDAMFPKSL